MELVPGNDDVRLTGPGVKLTYDDYVLFPDDGKRHELIDGEHYLTPSPNLKHQKVPGSLYLLIASWLEHNAIGQIFFAPFDVVFSRFDVVEPDLLYMSNERAAEVLTTANVQGAPELVIEIGSPGTRKRDETGGCTSARESPSTGLWIRRSMSFACIAAARTVSSGRSN
jgi:Uma2 family endonuclease